MMAKMILLCNEACYRGRRHDDARSVTVTLAPATGDRDSAKLVANWQFNETLYFYTNFYTRNKDNSEKGDDDDPDMQPARGRGMMMIEPS